MATTYTQIATQTLASNTATVTFSSISSAYTDLVFILNVKGSISGVDDDVTARFNSDTGSNYSWTRIYGDGTTAGSQRGSAQTVLRVGNQSGTGSSAFSPMILNIMNYSNTTTYKTMLARPNNPARVVDAYANLWRSTSAISTVSFACGGDFIAGSTFSLYGITAPAASPAPKATGGTITTTSGYTIHTFTETGTFTPSQNLQVEYLVVAGGGGGYYNGGSAGGAGGFRTNLNGALLSCSSGTGYTATVGAGGSTNTDGNVSSFNGVNASGGGGASGGGTLGGPGGSGAGGRTSLGAGGAGNVGGYFPVEGYAGGRGGNDGGGGGGGGAGGVGTDGSGGAGGAGGIGRVSLISGTSTYYAGGGGGSTGTAGGNGGLGGGGNGRVSSGAGGNGTVNTGGGAGGSREGSGGTGGSGIVIVRYRN